eukprot:4465813-Alexandrium_andersonii.AAC.1
MASCSRVSACGWTAVLCQRNWLMVVWATRDNVRSDDFAPGRATMHTATIADNQPHQEHA